MAKGFKHGAGGGPSLNFKLVGNPQPASPKDNTIWVNTDTPISGYHFGNEEPLVSDGNELTLATQHDGVYGTIDGSLVEDSNYTTKIFHIPTGTRKICIRIDNYSASDAAHAFFDKDRAPISPFHRKAGYDFIDVPDNAAYVVLAVRNSETVSVTGACAEEGTVWIPTGTSSTVPFNALKKNGITVYPLSTKQYVNGAWVERVAKSYQDGAWVDWWNGELYDNGNEYTVITGGWKAEAVTFTPDSGATPVAPTITNNGTSVKIKNGSGKGGIYRTINKVSFKNRTTLRFTGYASGDGEFPSGTPRCMMVVWSAIGKYMTENTVAQYMFPQGFSGSATIDVSALTGSYYVGFHVYGHDNITMQQLRLE